MLADNSDFARSKPTPHHRANAASAGIRPDISTLVSYCPVGSYTTGKHIDARYSLGHSPLTVLYSTFKIAGSFKQLNTL
jgi:hypothetical protein